jgi:catechol-2,3-dioxygenase
VTGTDFDGVCELVLESAEVPRMVEFYERLGLEVLAREGERTWLAAGDRCRLGIWPPGEQEHRDRGGTHVHFALAAARGRLDAMVDGLRRHEVAFEGPVVHDGGDRSLYLFDPEGNRVEVWDYFDRAAEPPA